MDLRVAPTERLIPISRVRSCTTMYMMFATPIPPTLSVKLPTIAKNSLNPRNRKPNMRSHSAVSQTWSASSSRGLKRYFLPSTS